MKKIILVFALALSTIAFAQTTLVDNQVNFEQVKALKEKAEAKVLTKDGISQYTASNSAVIKIGDKFRINRPEGGAKTFVSIQNKPTVMDMLGNSGFNSTVNTSMSNTEITIKTLFIAGTRKLGFKTMAELATCGTCNNLIVDIELAIETKEIRTNGMTKEEAIAKLKETKDLFDLGIVKQEDFDKLKAELTPIIIK
ncbi:hypothetical protein EKM02_03115 [Flavobacterium sp. RSP49]|uniref:hypothetical protein n=1 Tax=Flavobacterium sp. RSP49 TaxID=2497487 RepID=UPI000F841E9D|nr:hypothetical protein [Flavobacterium sp. RSP49]RTZ02517.1 hypothetical protein EKM02_03115 [Flavobacterium sp. RSP49]